MLEQELDWERGLFYFLNGSDSAFWDRFFYLYSDKWIWLPFYACILFALCYKRPWKEIGLTVVAIAVLIAACDQVSSGLIKPLCHRVRPTHHPDFEMHVATVFNYRGGGYGFVSSHAANAFGLATFLALFFRNRLFTGVILLYAVLTAYSRVYLGVHFVSDVVVGAAVGAVLGWLLFLLYNKVKERLKIQPVRESVRRAVVVGLCSAYAVFLLILFLFQNQLVSVFR